MSNRNAYFRDYMRKRRAKQKAANPRIFLNELLSGLEQLKSAQDKEATKAKAFDLLLGYVHKPSVTAAVNALDLFAQKKEDPQ